MKSIFYTQADVQGRILSEVNQTGIAVYGGNQGTPDLMVLIGRGIQIGLSLLGVVLLLYTLYAGFLWMTAGGEEENIKKAQGILRNAVIGIIIILASYSITLFVERALISGGLLTPQSDPTVQTTP